MVYQWEKKKANMKILFIYPSINKNFSLAGKIFKPLAIQPLAFAVLSALTPENWDRKLYDERIEKINFNESCDLVAISVETFNCKRAYQISEIFRRKGKRVILGGFHPSLCPQEAIKNADAIVIGEAEHVWKDVLADFKNNNLQKFYQSDIRFDMSGTLIDRSIFNGKRYFPISLVETGRGCRFNCDFCSIFSFYKGKYIRRPINEIISEIFQQKNQLIMFTDDNLCADFESAKELFKALMPLKIKWVAQSSMNIADDEELLMLMKRSGCMGILIGIESLDKKNLSLMKKNMNINYETSIDTIYKHGLKIYGSFVIGYDYDNKVSIRMMLNYSIKKRFYIANFYQLTPFPGTPLYKRLEEENRLLYKKWWLEKDYSYGKIVYKPKSIEPLELAQECWRARKKFYSIKSILLRLKFNCQEPSSIPFYLAVNFSSRKLAHKRQWLNLG